MSAELTSPAVSSASVVVLFAGEGMRLLHNAVKSIHSSPTARPWSRVRAYRAAQLSDELYQKLQRKSLAHDYEREWQREEELCLDTLAHSILVEALERLAKENLVVLGVSVDATEAVHRKLAGLELSLAVAEALNGEPEGYSS